jgi:predicted metal-dependent phosphoesterase TrpH
MKYKIDLHTHSSLSHDGGISELQYQKILNENLVNYIAITDHNSVELAIKLNSQLGERIIVGEEIMTTTGEIIGLYLTETIPPGLSPEQTIQKIRQQNGIVYIPHPFETIRKGLHPQVMEEIVNEIDIVEVGNGRAFVQNKSEQAVVWAKLNQKPGAASSDAHGIHGVGRTYTLVHEKPARNNLIELVSSSIPNAERPKIRALLYPKYNKIKKKVNKNV